MDDVKPEAKRCMTTLSVEMTRELDALKRATGLNESDLLRAGFVKVALEVKATGKLVLEPMPSLEPAA